MSGIFILWGIYIIVSSVLVHNKTGLLVVKTSSGNSSISVSKLSHDSSLLGRGNSRNRLIPGNYLVIAQSSGKTVYKVVSVFDKKTTNISLSSSDSYTVPSIYSVDFVNSSYLLAQGISNGQLGLIEKSLYSFKPTAKNLVFYDKSVYYAPVDINTATNFTMYFTLSIDSVQYKAAINYSNINNLDLSLYNYSSVKVFDSGVVSF